MRQIQPKRLIVTSTPMGRALGAMLHGQDLALWDRQTVQAQYLAKQAWSVTWNQNQSFIFKPLILTTSVIRNHCDFSKLELIVIWDENSLEWEAEIMKCLPPSCIIIRSSTAEASAAHVVMESCWTLKSSALAHRMRIVEGDGLKIVQTKKPSLARCVKKLFSDAGLRAGFMKQQRALPVKRPQTPWSASL